MADYIPKMIDMEWLKFRCQQSIESFEQERGFVKTDTPDGLTYLFKNNGANILAVAHRDVVERIANSQKFYLQENHIYAPQHDDRLGVHLILDILHLYGLNYDILLTEGEETGRSTAKYFTPPEGKQYGWMFEIDRMGLQTVMYGYHTQEKKELLESYGLAVGHGSFTDICELQDLKCWAVNFACAYYGQHTENCHVNVEELETKLLPNIIKFIKEKQNEHFAHERKARYITVYSSTAPYGGYSGGGYGKREKRSQEEISKRWERFTWSTSKQCFICDDCGRKYKDCEGVTCNFIDGAIKVGDTGCRICNIDGCIGYEKCICCGFYYHRSKCLQHIGYCYECLTDVFGVEPGTLANLFSLTPEIVDLAIVSIKNKIGAVIDHDDAEVAIQVVG